MRRACWRWITLVSLAFALVSCRTVSPPPPAALETRPVSAKTVASPQPVRVWSVKRVYDMGTDGGGYRTELRIDSGGEIVDEGRTFGSIPNYKPETYRRVSKASPEQLAALRSEIESLVRSSNGDAGTLGQWSITLNTDGQERSFGSADKTFTGAAGPLGAALEKISPWRPWLASVKGSGAGKAP